MTARAVRTAGRYASSSAPVTGKSSRKRSASAGRSSLRLGVEEESLVLGTVNAGHPGGMLPLTARDAASLHPARLPGNLYVSDASLLPRSLGNPPILTIMALAKAIGRKVKETAA